MEFEELIKCQEIFGKKTSWFSFQTDGVTAKLKCLEIFRDKGKPQHIIFLWELLKDSNSVLRVSAADTIVWLLKKANSHNEFYNSFKYVPFEKDDINYYKNTFSTEVYLHLLSIASLNGNGYIREQAVNEMVELQSPKTIKFIIFRLGDWVGNVRQAAEKAIRYYLQPIYIDEFLKQLSLIDWLLKVGRTDLTNIYTEIYQFIFSFDLNSSFYRKLNRFNDKTKLLYIRNYLNSKASTKEVFQLLADDDLFLVKIELLKHIEKLDEEMQKLFVHKFLKDRSAKVRVYAIYSTKPFRVEFQNEILDSIFDVSASVRELARFILRESSIDFTDFYRQRLNADENSHGAILGLSEVRTPADLPIFESYIQKPNVKVKVACLSAINALNKQIARNYAMDLLSHSSAKIRNKSFEILASTADDEVLEKARDVYRSGNYEQKKSILKMFSQIGGWKIVGDLIIALSDANENIRQLGWISLEKWRRKQLFTKPRPEDLARTLRLYDEFNKDKSKLPTNRERFWSDLPFYLS